MASRSDGGNPGAAGVTNVGGLGILFGLVYAVVGVGWLLVGDTLHLVLGGATLLLAVLLVPTGLGIVWRAPWAWLLGIVVFVGLASVQTGSFLVVGVSLFRLVLAAAVMSCGLYLVFAREEFEDTEHSREVHRIHHP